MHFLSRRRRQTKSVLVLISGTWSHVFGGKAKDSENTQRLSNGAAWLQKKDGKGLDILEHF
jgi:hypothetical protein